MNADSIFFNEKPLKGAKNQISQVIIAGKTYKVNELYSVFSTQALMLASKEELYEYWNLAVETGIKQFITIVDNVFNKKYPRWE